MGADSIQLDFYASAARHVPEALCFWLCMVSVCDSVLLLFCPSAGIVVLKLQRCGQESCTDRLLMM